VGNLTPGVLRGRVDVDARRVLPIGREAADDEDLTAHASRSHLAARERKRGAVFPLRRRAGGDCRKEDEGGEQRGSGTHAEHGTIRAIPRRKPVASAAPAFRHARPVTRLTWMDAEA